MKQHLRIDVLEDDDAVTVKFKTTSQHLQDCPHCIAALALHVANSFHNAMMDAQARAADDEDDDSPEDHAFLH
jgi:hypothetical protein